MVLQVLCSRYRQTYKQTHPIRHFRFKNAVSTTKEYILYMLIHLVYIYAELLGYWTWITFGYWMVSRVYSPLFNVEKGAHGSEVIRQREIPLAVRGIMMDLESNRDSNPTLPFLFLSKNGNLRHFVGFRNGIP
jgi:hypothetical protein